MKECDYEEIVEQSTKKTFANEDQKTFWEAFSQGAKDGEERTFFTGNIQAMSNYLGIEREREKQNARER